jgi:hypothetical protein
VSKRAWLGLDAVGKGRDLERELRLELHALEPADMALRQERRLRLVDPDPERERVHQASTVDQRAVLREQPTVRIAEGPQRERALPASGRECHGDRAGWAAQSKPVQTRQPACVQVLADSGEEEQVGRLVDEVRVLALNDDPCPRAVENRERPAEVVDDGAGTVLVDDVARRHERRAEIAERVVVGTSPSHDHLDCSPRPRCVVAKPREVACEIGDHVGPVAAEPHAQAVHGEIDGRRAIGRVDWLGVKRFRHERSLKARYWPSSRRDSGKKRQVSTVW